ncbi:hypothetical protein K470DRAFT_50583 [Piedraia hortae CBS 480.64]|uniref:Secreted protein n=1 Tax=Piedraia hortae CBS 480.64 TaxID=1314780 RepID=A0A6A7C9H4_9PEZI|nr:hypothetical protein K470DRAFT_50583 [Piedraia hortae CBS 480.64]
MKPTLILAFLAGAYALTDEEHCHKKNKYAPEVIRQLCNTDTMRVPNSRAFAGITNQGAMVTIDGTTCKSEWIPQKYCLSQFFNMCAHGDRNGQATASYGTHGCQKWQIQGIGKYSYVGGW